MKLTKRELWALRTMLDFDIARYLMSVTFGRKEGAERADLHIAISKVLAEFIFLGDYRKVTIATMPIHDFLAHILTDRLDEVIDFPIDRTLYGNEYDVYKDRFFQTIIGNMNDIVLVAKGAKEKPY